MASEGSAGGGSHRALQQALEALWRDIEAQCVAGNIRKADELVAKLKQCTFLAGPMAVRLAWGRVCFRRPLPFILRALIDSSQTAPIGELDLSDNQVGDEHVKLLTTYIINSTHLRTLDLSANQFSPSSAEVLRIAASKKQIRLAGCAPPSPGTSLPPRPHQRASPRARTPPVTADAVGALQEKVDAKVKSLGLQHAGQLEEERDRLMREMSLPKRDGSEVVSSVRQAFLQRERAATPPDGGAPHAGHRFHQESPGHPPLHVQPSPMRGTSPSALQSSRLTASPQTAVFTNSGLSAGLTASSPHEAFFDAPMELRKPYTPLKERLTSPHSAAHSVMESFGDDEESVVTRMPFRSLNAHALASKGAPLSLPAKNRIAGNSAAASRDLSFKYTEGLAPQQEEERDPEEAFDIAEDVPDSFVIRDYSRAKLTSIEHKDLSRITVLVLRQNSITELKGLPRGLTRLDVSANLLTSLAGLSACPQLEMLAARCNTIGKIGTALHACRGLRVLLLGRNRVRRVEGLEHLSELMYLDLGHNELATPASVRTLSLNVALKTLVLAGNPLSHPSGRRRICISNLPSSCTEAAVHALLRSYGAVEDVSILSGRTGKDGRLAAFATFSDSDVVARACATVLAHQEPMPGVPPFKVEVKGKKGRLHLSRIDGKVDRATLMQMLSLHGIVESLELSEPRWERNTPAGWTAFDDEHRPRLDAAYQRQGTCKVLDMTIRMVSMTADTPQGVVSVRMHREGVALFVSGTACAERAKAALSGLTWQGDAVPLVVRHMPDYQPLVHNLLPHLALLDRRVLHGGKEVSVPVVQGSAVWSSLVSSDRSALDVSTAAAHRMLKSNNSSFDRSRSLNSPGYAVPGRAKQTIQRMGKAREEQEKHERKIRRFGLQPNQQGAIVKEHAKRRSRSAPTQPLRLDAGHDRPDPSDDGSELLPPEMSSVLPTPIRPVSKNLVPTAYKRKSVPAVGGAAGGASGASGFASIAGDRQDRQPLHLPHARRSHSTPSRGMGRRHSGQAFSATPSGRSDMNGSVDSAAGELRSALRRLSSAVADTSKDRPAEKRGVSFSGNLPPRDLAMEGSTLESVGSDVHTMDEEMPAYDAEPLPDAVHAGLGGPPRAFMMPPVDEAYRDDHDAASSHLSSVARTASTTTSQRQKPPTPNRRPSSPRLADALAQVEQASSAVTPSATPTRERARGASEAPSPLVSEKIQLFYDQLQALHKELSHNHAQGQSPHHALLRLLTPKTADREERREQRPQNPRHARPGTSGPPEVQDWLDKLKDDFMRAHLALKALVVLCAAAKREEQLRYRGIIEGCGMLSDTEVPPVVVRHYKLTEQDLQAQPAAPATQLDALLIVLKQLSDTKTCLKYIFALIQQGQPGPLQEYAAQVKVSPLVTRDPSTFVL